MIPAYTCDCGGPMCPWPLDLDLAEDPLDTDPDGDDGDEACT